MELSEYQEACKRTAGTFPSHEHAALYWVAGLVGECGEFLATYDTRARIPEAGDALWYAAMLATEYGLALKPFPGVAASPTTLLAFACKVAERVKKNVGHGRDIGLPALDVELGSIVTILERLSGGSLADVMTTNVHKLRTRYPDGFSKEASAKRVDLARSWNGETKSWEAH